MLFLSRLSRQVGMKGGGVSAIDIRPNGVSRLETLAKLNPTMTFIYVSGAGNR